MALINFLRFNHQSGAIITDEEFWTPRFRKRLHIDNLHSLLDDDTRKLLNMEIAYGGVGYPSVHQEVVVQTQRKLREILRNEASDRPVPERVRDIARLAFETLQFVIRRRIDQKLLFKFGFSTDDFNRGFYEKDGTKIEIKNKEIRQEAQKILTAKEKDALLKPAMDAKAAVFGWDASSGMTGYYLDSQDGILAYNYEGFEAIGSGKYASGMVFGTVFGAKTLAMRQAGFEPAEGVLELISSALAAQYHFKEVGGNLNFVLISAEKKDPAERYREIFDDTARLTTEIVKAYRFNELERDVAITLIDRLLFSAETWESMDRELFATVKNTERFTLLLRNYKMGEVDQYILPALHESEGGEAAS